MVTLMLRLVSLIGPMSVLRLRSEETREDFIALQPEILNVGVVIQTKKLVCLD